MSIHKTQFCESCSPGCVQAEKEKPLQVETAISAAGRRIGGIAGGERISRKEEMGCRQEGRTDTAGRGRRIGDVQVRGRVQALTPALKVRPAFAFELYDLAWLACCAKRTAILETVRICLRRIVVASAYTAAPDDRQHILLAASIQKIFLAVSIILRTRPVDSSTGLVSILQKNYDVIDRIARSKGLNPEQFHALENCRSIDDAFV